MPGEGAADLERDFEILMVVTTLHRNIQNIGLIKAALYRLISC